MNNWFFWFFSEFFFCFGESSELPWNTFLPPSLEGSHQKREPPFSLSLSLAVSRWIWNDSWQEKIHYEFKPGGMDSLWFKNLLSSYYSNKMKHTFILVIHCILTHLFPWYLWKCSLFSFSWIWLKMYSSTYFSPLSHRGNKRVKFSEMCDFNNQGICLPFNRLFSFKYSSFPHDALSCQQIMVPDLCPLYL